MATMPAILCDHNVEGQLQVIYSIWTSPEWIELWEMFECRVHNFRSIGIPKNISDHDLWLLCQTRGFILLTANRNADSDESLEIASQKLNQPCSLPILTIADAERVMDDRQYAERIASRILDILFEFQNLGGTRRLFVP